MRNALRRSRKAESSLCHEATSSDHGFPDPATGLTSQWEEKHKLSHDLVLTDDNILIPLFIRYPGCRPSRCEVPVGSLDLFPTILELVGIPDVDDAERSTGTCSLVPLMEGGGRAAYPRRHFRCDARLMFQAGRATAIRGARFKYIRFHDQHGISPAADREWVPEVLLDLKQDKAEERNLLTADRLSGPTRRILRRYRREFERSERRAVEFQVDRLVARQREEIGALAKEEKATDAVRALLLFEPDTAAYTSIGLQAVSRAFPGIRIDIVTGESDAVPIGDGNVRVFRYSRSDEGAIHLPDLGATRAAGDGYDLSLLFVQNPSDSIAARLLRLGRRVRSRRHLVVDCNFNIYRRRNYLYYRLRTLRERLPHLLREPELALAQSRKGARVLVRHLLRRFGLWERWTDASAAVRDGGRGP